MKFEVIAVATTVTEASDIASRKLLQEQLTALELGTCGYKFCPLTGE
jgi:hypothetical protein